MRPGRIYQEQQTEQHDADDDQGNGVMGTIPARHSGGNSVLPVW